MKIKTDINITAIAERPSCNLMLKVELGPNDEVTDLIFLKVDKLYETFVNRRAEDIIGRSYYEIFEIGDEGWKDVAYRVAYQGEEVHGRIHVKEIDRFMEFDVAQVSLGVLTIVFRDITDSHLQHRQTERSNNTADVIITCAKYLRQGDNFYSALDMVLEEIGNAIHPEKIFILEMNNDGRVKIVVRRGEEFASNGSYSSIPKEMRAYLEKYGKVVIEDVESIKDSEPEVYERMKRSGAHSMMGIPLYDHQKLIGIMGVNNFRADEQINTEELLETVSLFVEAEMRNYRLMKRLEFLSGNDLLTGVNNRNALNATLEQLNSTHDRLGVLYADLNGLKMVNDEQGHRAGDALLKSAADLLREVFDVENIYRAGGDEFVVLETDVSEREFQEKAQKVYSLSGKRGNPSIAVGWQWTADSSTVNSVMIQADQSMYDDKELYYLTHTNAKKRRR